MAVRHPLFVANGTAGVTSPQDARLALAALLSGPGILNGFNVSGSSSGPNMKYNVAAGAVVTQRGTLAADGLYLWTNDGTYTVDTGAPAPTSGSRYDVIYALAKNANDGFGDANSDPVIGFVVGTASSTPAVPAAPAGALVLAQALVGTNAANAAAAGVTITNVAPVTTLRSGVLPEATGVRPSAAYRGMYVDDAVSGLTRYDGTGWTGPLTMVWQARQNTSTTSLTNNAYITIPMDTQDVNTTGIALGGGSFRAPVAGIYRVSGLISFASNGTGARGGAFALNGNNIDGSFVLMSGSGGLTRLTMPTILVTCAVNDVISMLGFQSSGAALSTATAPGSRLTVERV